MADASEDARSTTVLAGPISMRTAGIRVSRRSGQ